jgi:hypothetical protein
MQAIASGKIRDYRSTLINNVRTTKVERFPFDHFFIENIFPSDLYRQIRTNLPPTELYSPISGTGYVKGGTYQERCVFDFIDSNISRLAAPEQDFWLELIRFLIGNEFIQTVLSVFAVVLQERFGASPNIRVVPSAALIRDLTHYTIGPHTDHPGRMLSMLFYLPENNSLRDLGTSVYVPKDPQFTCEGGPHHLPERFTRVRTLPFVPNSVLAFPKSNRCFHGVEPISRPDVERDVLLVNVEWKRLCQ